MSFKMENRPSFRGKSLTEMTVTEKDNAIIECVQWFEGFEKRQRQNLADYEKALEEKAHWDKEFLACWKAISNYIKLEVLGKEA
ncbi:hypothetical protein MUP77_00405 [Candidatus Bathyarchaeota archaeon]|nr:hypothetical protein [Candidatus Bathyarchaeota archaeon]